MRMPRPKPRIGMKPSPPVRYVDYATSSIVIRASTKSLPGTPYVPIDSFKTPPDPLVPNMPTEIATRRTKSHPKPNKLRLSIGLHGTSSGRKAYAQVVVEKRPKQTDEPKIAFEVGDAKYLDRDDALVVLIRIANAHEKGHS
ncbi:hypothetical protein B296_00014543 [Ensete ventricosum]|uniref:Uncharacterized protein n=1 Tax=Ensete ventricosum TaxID=4639 RepID=A0A426YEP7_ENSVE|nr:hypothetical protein B296_00014543 [Ensete ventricosum]